MALFRDRRGFPRWSFIDSRSLPSPRHAKENTVLEPPPNVAPGPAADAPAPVVKVHAALDEFLNRDASSPVEPPVDPTPPARVKPVVSWESPEPEPQPEPEPEPQPAPEPETATPEPSVLRVPEAPQLPEGYETWLDERRDWFGAHDGWPVEATEESVQLAGTHPPRPYIAPSFPGLPVDSPAEVRARHGRGFSSFSRRRRRRRHGHEVEQRRADIDLAAIENALDQTAQAVGDALVDVVVWHSTTGLPLAGRGTDPVAASLWHHATRDVRSTLPYADLPELGPYHLVGLADRRLAVLVHASPDLGACVTVELDVVAVDVLLGSTIPTLHESLAAASQEL